MNDKILNILRNISTPDEKVVYETQKLLDNLTKPQGSLGMLEEVAKKVAAITRIAKPKIAKKFVFVFAADHGIVEEDISSYPQDVTTQMVYNFLRGGAAINVIAKHVNAEVFIVDVGVKNKIEIKNFDKVNFIDRKINCGTKNFLKEPAMSYNEAEKSILVGIEVVEEVIKSYQRQDNETFLFAIGEMGIGNTTVASVITAIICGYSPVEVAGRGTGVDDERYKNKLNVIESALSKYKFEFPDGIDILSKVGGYEIGAMVGVILGAAYYKIPVILDGFISTSAALIASSLCCRTINYMIAGHLSEEPGHKLQLEFLGLKPILNLNMKLGEATGACLAIDIVELSCKILNEMATFETAGVSRSI